MVSLFVYFRKNFQDTYRSIFKTYSSGFPLLRRTIKEILALFIVCTKGSSIISGPSLINFGGILSTPTAFLTSICFKSFLSSGAFICSKSNLSLSQTCFFYL